MKQIQAWLLDHQVQMADELEQLCNLNSGSDNLRGLNQVADWLSDYFSPLAANPEKIELPRYEIEDDLGVRRSNATGPALRWNIPGSTRSENKKKLLLTIHYDTVYGPESPFQICQRFEGISVDGQPELRMRGPGVIDAKEGIIVMR